MSGQPSTGDLMKKLNEVQEIMNLNMCKFEQLFNELHVKFDIAINTEPISQSQKNKQDKSNAKKPPGKPVYIKDEIKKNKDIFLNILYTQEEFDKCMEHKDVQKQKSDADKLKKVAEILYKEVINLSDTYKKKATSLHNEFKKNFAEQQKEENINNTEDTEEETKLNNS